MNCDEDVQWSERDVSDFENTDAVGHDAAYGHGLAHQPHLEILQQLLGTPLQNLTHDRRARFGRVNPHVDVKAGRLKNDLPAIGRLTPRICRRHLMPAVENQVSNECLVIYDVFDDLEFEKFCARPILEFDGVLIEHRTKRVSDHTDDDCSIPCVKMGILGQDEDAIVCFETLH